MNIRTIGVAGLGLLGRGIAACLLGHKFTVIAFTRRQSTHDSAREYIARAVKDLVEKAGFPPELQDEWSDRYVAVDSCASFAECDFVIESIVEDMAAKQEIFDEIEAVVCPEVPIASNTSALPISHLQRGRRHPERFVGMHWAEPAYITRFMELIRGEQTSDATFKAAEALASTAGKEPSLVQKDVPAFCINRMGYAMYREAVNIIERGIADVETVDRSFRNALGLWATLCGPLRWIDISGGPVLYAKGIERVLPDLNNSTELPEMLKKMIADDAQGTINGRGFYQYTEGEAKKWDDLYHKHAWRVRELLDEYCPLEENRPDE